MNISLRCEDAEGGTWEEDAEIEGLTEDELIDAAIDAAHDCFSPAWDATGKRIDGPVTVSCEVNDRSIEVTKDNDVTVY